MAWRDVLFHRPRLLVDLTFTWCVQLFGRRRGFYVRDAEEGYVWEADQEMNPEAMDPGPLWIHHALNFAGHSVNCLLFFEFCRPILPPELAELAAVLYCVHPVQAAGVCYLAGRAGILSNGFAFLLAIAAGIHSWPLGILGALGIHKTKPDGWILAAGLILFAVLKSGGV
jgi:hypothetical protein